MEGDKVAGAKCLEVNWGREKLPCYGWEGTLLAGREKGERERWIEGAACVHTRRKPL